MCQIQKSQKSAILLHPNVLVPTAARAGKAAMCQIQKSQKVLYHSTLMFSFLQRPELGWYTVSLSFMACNQAQLGFPPYNVVISRILKKMYVVFSEAMRIFLQKCNISAKPSFLPEGEVSFSTLKFYCITQWSCRTSGSLWNMSIANPGPLSAVSLARYKFSCWCYFLDPVNKK